PHPFHQARRPRHRPAAGQHRHRALRRQRHPEQPGRRTGRLHPGGRAPGGPGRVTSGPSQRLLIVDDDDTFSTVLAKAMGRRGFAVAVAENVDDALAVARRLLPTHAVVDLRMPGPSGLSLIPALKTLDPAMRVVVLTGYASIATAVEAIKLGATQYLAKPVDADQIIAAFADDRRASADPVPVRAQPLSVDRLEWEHIQKVLSENGGNVSATARALNMHRRSLQRKLGKRPVRN
ncbi:MAG: response regulator transcription factor, partial [Propionibacteriaceae bacterium]|nr:response regulator transcription factor [Propionibacteriaceae bacterium]